MAMRMNNFRHNKEFNYNRNESTKLTYIIDVNNVHGRGTGSQDSKQISSGALEGRFLHEKDRKQGTYRWIKKIQETNEF